ncbi:hypothetical protein [Streptomyces sp. NPDC088748]|uniref:hypothetical protein n=1 Tax=Streptomyces sp. NPDC088748 TaxID=3365887 RepID=UPI00382BBCAB
MNQDEDLAAALQQAVAGLPMEPAPVETVVRLGRKMRRRRQATLSTALAAAVLIPASAVAALSLGSFGSRTPTVPAASAAASAQVQVVGPGEKVALGRNNMLWLTGQGMFLVTPKSSGTTKQSVLNAAEIPSGKISATASGGASGTLYAGIYRGPGKASRITVAIGSRTLNTQVITWAGSPGWAAFYADDTQAGAIGMPAPTITVQAADGTILASMTKQAQLTSSPAIDLGRAVT